MLAGYKEAVPNTLFFDCLTSSLCENLGQSIQTIQIQKKGVWKTILFLNSVNTIKPAFENYLEV